MEIPPQITAKMDFIVLINKCLFSIPTTMCTTTYTNTTRNTNTQQNTGEISCSEPNFLQDGTLHSQ